MNIPGSELLRVRDAAEYLGISPNTLYVQRTQDRGPKSVLIHNKLWYSRADLDAYIRAQAKASVRGGVE